MASVPVVLNGIFWDDAEKAGKKGVFYGELSLAGLSVGGGPIMPPGQPPGIWPSPGYPAHPIAPGGPPPGIWPGPGPLPHPEHPIAPGGPPPSVWPDPGRPHPEHPIVLPPENPGEEPKWALKAVWVPAVGWVTVVVPVGDQPIPTPSR